jgi:TonB C terminal
MFHRSFLDALLRTFLIAVVCLITNACSSEGIGPDPMSGDKGPSKFKRQMEVGDSLLKSGDLDQAISSYNRAASLPHGWGWDRDHLVLKVEEIMTKRPFDPAVRILLGRAFESNGELAAAELEYRQALAVSLQEKNEVASQLLSGVVYQRKLNSWPDLVFNSHAHKSPEDKFRDRITEAWHPPQHAGVLMSRCTLLLSKSGKVHKCEVDIPSGSKTFDDSIIRAIHATQYGDILLPVSFDFGCLSEAREKPIEYYAYHRIMVPDD